MGARSWSVQLLCWARAAGVTVTHEPFKLRDPGSIPGRPTARSVRPGCEHMFVPQHQPLVDRAGRPPSVDRRCPVARKHCVRHGATEFAQYSDGEGGRRWRCAALRRGGGDPAASGSPPNVDRRGGWRMRHMRLRPMQRQPFLPPRRPVNEALPHDDVVRQVPCRIQNRGGEMRAAVQQLPRRG